MVDPNPWKHPASVIILCAWETWKLSDAFKGLDQPWFITQIIVKSTVKPSTKSKGKAKVLKF